MKTKRFAALAAVSMLGIQLMGAGAAFAAQPDAGIDSECDFGSDSLEITLGYSGTGTKGDVEVWIDADGVMNCKDSTSNTPFTQAASSLDSVTVEMDDSDSNGELTIYLDDNGGTGTDASEWPEFDTFDIDVTTRVYVDGGNIDDSSANRLRVTVGAKSLSFLGTSATVVAPSFDIDGGAGGDTIDASKSAARIYADGGDGSDTIKGGSGKDNLDGGTGGSADYNVDVIYGNGGNDTITCSGDGTETRLTQGWGGEGDDSITNCNIVAPGAGNDDIYNAGGTYDGDYDGNDATDDPETKDTLFSLSYADLSKGIEWDSSELITGGAAGEDVLSDAPFRFYGSQGDDAIYDDAASRVYGNGGNDVIKVDGVGKVFGGAGDDVVIDASGTQSDDTFYGQGGNDVLRGKSGDDSLFGGAGKDQTWGGPGGDTCGAEITNRCEYFKK